MAQRSGDSAAALSAFLQHYRRISVVAACEERINQSDTDLDIWVNRRGSWRRLRPDEKRLKWNEYKAGRSACQSIIRGLFGLSEAQYRKVHQSFDDPAWKTWAGIYQRDDDDFDGPPFAIVVELPDDSSEIAGGVGTAAGLTLGAAGGALLAKYFYNRSKPVPEPEPVLQSVSPSSTNDSKSTELQGRLEALQRERSTALTEKELRAAWPVVRRQEPQSGRVLSREVFDRPDYTFDQRWKTLNRINREHKNKIPKGTQATVAQTHDRDRRLQQAQNEASRRSLKQILDDNIAPHILVRELQDNYLTHKWGFNEKLKGLIVDSSVQADLDLAVYDYLKQTHRSFQINTKFDDSQIKQERVRVLNEIIDASDRIRALDNFFLKATEEYYKTLESKLSALESAAR